MNNREIDKLIAEKVMGWLLPDSLCGCEMPIFSLPVNARICGKCGFLILPWFSTGIDDAWRIVERLVAQYHIKIESHNLYTPPGWIVTIETAQGNIAFTHQSLPMAICLAALKAAGVDTGEAGN